MSPIRVLVADSRAIARGGLVCLLGAAAEVEVVAEAHSAQAALAAVEDAAPDVALLTMELDGGTVRTVQLLRREHPSIRVVVLSDDSDPSWVRSVVAAGVHAFLLSRDRPQDLVQAILAVCEGRAWVSVAVAEDLRYLVDGEVERELSGREEEVLVLMALGHTYKVISERLDISTKTIEGYRTRICERLGFETRADLVRYCLESGLLDPRRVQG